MEYSNRQIREIIEDWIHSERDREVLCYRLIDGLTIDQICTRYQDKHPECYLSGVLLNTGVLFPPGFPVFRRVFSF